MKYLAYFLFVIFLIHANAESIEQHMLLYAPCVESPAMPILEIHPNGEITYNKQIIHYSGIYDYPSWGDVNPDLSRVAIPNSGYIYQYLNHPNGVVTSLDTSVVIGPIGYIFYHPNKMLLFADGSTGTILSITSTGKFDTNNIHFFDGFVGRFNPEGNLMVSLWGNYIKTYQIDTINYSATSIQSFFMGGTMYEGCFTPDGKQYVVSNYGKGHVQIFKVLPEGKLDTTYSAVTLLNTSTGFSLAGPKTQAMSLDGKFLFVGGEASDMIVTLAKNTITGAWYQTPYYVNIKQPWHVRFTPDWNLLVVRHLDTTGWNLLLSTYRVLPTGQLTYTGYSFPFSQTFGDHPIDLQIAYPPGLVDIPKNQWEFLE